MNDQEAIYDKDLTHKQELFCQYYVRDGNATSAAKACGTPLKYARQSGYKMLLHPQVEARVKYLRAELCRKINIQAEQVHQELAKIALHDSTAISQIRHNACPRCMEMWRKQSAGTANERETARDLAELTGEEFDEWPYYIPDTPHPDCDECNGEGITEAWFADFRDLGPCERAAVKGVSVGKYGIRIHIADKLQALDVLAKILGLYDRQEPSRDEQVTIILNGIKIPSVSHNP